MDAPHRLPRPPHQFALLLLGHSWCHWTPTSCSPRHIDLAVGQAHQVDANGDVAVIFRELRRAVRVDDPVLQAIRRAAVIDEVHHNRRNLRKR